MGILEAVVLILFGIFAYMKITEKGTIAEWSWWRVTSPLWIYGIIAVVIYGIILGGMGVMMSTVPMTIQ